MNTWIARICTVILEIIQFVNKCVYNDGEHPGHKVISVGYIEEEEIPNMSKYKKLTSFGIKQIESIYEAVK
jgi:hypothetical protein